MEPHNRKQFNVILEIEKREESWTISFAEKSPSKRKKPDDSLF